MLISRIEFYMMLVLIFFSLQSYFLMFSSGKKCSYFKRGEIASGDTLSWYLFYTLDSLCVNRCDVGCFIAQFPFYILFCSGGIHTHIYKYIVYIYIYIEREIHR
jgi:hypothetical protein